MPPENVLTRLERRSYSCTKLSISEIRLLRSGPLTAYRSAWNDMIVQALSSSYSSKSCMYCPGIFHNIMPKYHDLPRSRFGQTADNINCCSFSGSIWTKQTKDFTVFHY